MKIGDTVVVKTTNESGKVTDIQDFYSDTFVHLDVNGEEKTFNITDIK